MRSELLALLSDARDVQGSGAAAALLAEQQQQGSGQQHPPNVARLVGWKYSALAHELQVQRAFAGAVFAQHPSSSARRALTCDAAALQALQGRVFWSKARVCGGGGGVAAAGGRRVHPRVPQQPLGDALGRAGLLQGAREVRRIRTPCSCPPLPQISPPWLSRRRVSQRGGNRGDFDAVHAGRYLYEVFVTSAAAPGGRPPGTLLAPERARDLEDCCAVLAALAALLEVETRLLGLLASKSAVSPLVAALQVSAPSRDPLRAFDRKAT